MLTKMAHTLAFGFSLLTFLERFQVKFKILQNKIENFYMLWGKLIFDRWLTTMDLLLSSPLFYDSAFCI